MKKLESLVAELDAETRALLPAKYMLVLWGDLDNSPFLRAVKRKAKSFGIDVAVNTFPVTPCRMIADKETAGQIGYVSGFEDVDNLMHDGLSGVAEAVLRVLGDVEGKNVAVVGRGHSVKGLVEALILNDATVTVAHSKTRCLLTATKGKDIVIYATPTLDKVIAYDTEDLVIDLGGAVEHPDWLYCECLAGIGPLTVSVLLHRFVTGR